MSKTEVIRISLGGGWTPVSDVVVRKHGGVYAAILGLIWCYCQGTGGECWASHETIAKRLGISRATVVEYSRRLVKDGYLKDLGACMNKRALTDKSANLITTQNIDGKLWALCDVLDGKEIWFEVITGQPRCSMCGYSGPSLQHHHVHGRKNSNETILVCANCHIETHEGQK